MAIPQNKDELLAAIQTHYRQLQEELTCIPEHLTQQKKLDGHTANTMMSIADLVAYLIGWGELVLKWNNKKDRGEPVELPEVGYKWNELGKLAQKFYIDYDTTNYSSLIQKLDYTIDSLLELIHQKSNTELYEIPWYNEWTLGRMIQLNTSSPFQNARIRIRRWKKEQQLYQESE
jgi:hypothetical protein